MSEKNFNFICVHKKGAPYTIDSFQNERYINLDQIIQIECLIDADHPDITTLGSRIIYNWVTSPEMLDVYETIPEIIQLIKRVN